MADLSARLGAVERRADLIESALRTIQTELTAVRDDRLSLLEARTDSAERALAAVGDETARLRDRVVPAAVGRTDALLERLAGEIEETSSIVERMLLGEPLPAGSGDPDMEARLAAALAEVQPLLLESFRGDESEIRHRLDHYLDDLCGAPPVLDLGCGRGELLLMLREAGVESAGVESDPALAAAARRRGLVVHEGDVLEVLGGVEAGSVGAVTAIHLFEHLAPAVLSALLAQAHRVLRPGGVLVAECPNPHSLRVGAALFWQDPTHRRPLLPETLELFLQSAGFIVRTRELLHPFPDDQLLVDDEGGTRAVTDVDLTTLAERVDRLRVRLDELLNAPRDFAIRAEKPADPATT